LQLVSLAFVHFPPLEDLERFLLDGGFAGAVAHFGELGLVALEFGVDGGEFYVDGFYALVDLGWVGLDGLGMVGRGGGEVHF